MGLHVRPGLTCIVQDKEILELNHETAEPTKEQRYKATGRMPAPWFR